LHPEVRGKNTSGNNGIRRNWLWLGLPLAIYLLFPTRNYYWDGIAFAINVEKQLPLRETLHPNHLLYTVANVWLYRLAMLIGIRVRALFLMQFVNSLLAAASGVLIYRALRRRQMSISGSVAGALVFGFAATWWKFATDANAYIPSIFLVLCANDLLETRRNPVLAALVHAGAMLFHELALLFLPVALFGLKEPGLKEPSLKERGAMLAYGASSLTPVGIAYILSYTAVFGRFDAAGLLRWITSHSPDSAFSWRPLRDVGLTLLGTLRLFLGGKPGRVIGDPLAIAGSVALAVCLVALVFAWRRGGPQRLSAPAPDLLIWVGIYIVFLFFWLPGNTFYRLFYLPPLVVIACCAVRNHRVDRFLPALFCGAIFLWNFVFLIYPQSLIKNNPILQFALAQHQQWPPGSVIAFHRFEPDLWTISYFNPQASWIGLDALDLGRLEQYLADARQRHQPLWLDASAYEFISSNPDGRQWLASRGAALFEVRDPKHDFRFYELR
jgi:hypothetical protein